MMQLSPTGLAFVEARESFRSRAYPDSTGIPTVGYGSTGPDVHLGLTVTHAWASARLARDMGAAVSCVNQHVSTCLTLTQGEFDSLCDLAYNIGLGAFEHSTLLLKLDTGDFVGAEAEFQKWDKAGGRTLVGLANRRKAEEQMFAKGAA